MISLLQKWKNLPVGSSDATAFIRVLESPRSPSSDKAAILRVFNDWNILVNTWFEVADALPAIELLLETPQFPDKNSAALLISKIYYCLEQYEKALVYALKANDEFKVVPRAKTGLGNDSEYVNKMIEVAIDNYKILRKTEGKDIKNEKLQALIRRISQRNLESNEIWHVIALGFETNDLDMIINAINTMPAELHKKHEDILAQTMKHVIEVPFDHFFRITVLQSIVLTYWKSPIPDLSKICLCYIIMNCADDTADMIINLVNKGKTSKAFQIAFDLNEKANFAFLEKVMRRFATVDGKKSPASPKPVTNTTIPSAIDRIHSILKGQETVRLHLDFLCRHNHSDTILMEELRESVRSASGHNALLMANGLMHYGTTCDDFLRNNLTWVSKATNWNKFNAVASLGLIHRGQEASALRLLDSYLPKSENAEGYGFKEGGAMFAYGMIHAQHGNPASMSILGNWMKSAQNEPTRHGAALGFGLAGMGSHDLEVYEELRAVMYKDEAVSGEAAGIACGLVMAGHMSRGVWSEMKSYALDTQHDKTMRGIRTGLACAAVGCENEVEMYVEEAARYKSNPWMRSTTVCMISTAYAGTGSSRVVRRLLEKVATDPNSDVKRYATIGIGFVLCRDPTACLSYIGMLVEHYNGHVRYGSAMALAIACASTGNMEAITLIEPLLSDKEGYVRNGALIALAMIMCQQTDYTCPKVSGFRKLMLKKVSEKNEESLVKFGAIIAQGLMDIGGQNAALTMLNSDGNVDMGSVVGMMCFLHGWYWHSMHMFAALVAKPSNLLVVNTDLKIPRMDFVCDANIARFAFAAKTETKKDKNVKKIETVILSITGKRGRKADKKKLTTVCEEENMEIEVVKKKEPIDLRTFHVVNNPARVVPLQRKLMSLTHDFEVKYKLMRPVTSGGIVVAEHIDGKTPEELVEEVIATNTTTCTPKADPKPHEPFEIDITKY